MPIVFHSMSTSIFATFLENAAPGTSTNIEHSLLRVKDSDANHFLKTCDLHINCDYCNGIRYFEYTDELFPLDNLSSFKIMMTYRCRNCRVQEKVFGVIAWFDYEDGSWTLQKLGETPQFGLPVSPSTMKIVGPDRQQFLKGRNCEVLGLGIGAFAYYRRVVENQKNRIYDEILRISQHSQMDPELVKQIEAAKGEIQFTKSVEKIKAALPTSVLVGGENPLLLLHSALSKGVHELSDEECLSLANDIRTVLNEFSERLSTAIKGGKEINEAVKRLKNKRT